MSWRGGLLVACGVGAALIGGAGVASADSSGTGSSPKDSAHSVAHSRPASHRAVKKPARLGTMRSTPPMLSARREPGSGLAGPAPRPPVQPPGTDPVAAVTRWFDDLHYYLTGAPETHPTPADTTATVYGDIGKWMLERDGSLADWPSPAYPFKTLYQPINVIVVDRTSTTATESAQKINAAMAAAGFPAQQIHSTGYQGLIDGVLYGQQPAGPQEAFSNAHWLLINDHGRLFGPSPDAADSGFVWTASFSREQPGLSNLNPTHIYVSFDKARDAVRAGLVGSGAIDLGLVALDNKLSGRTITTGDHDGYAVVISVS
ncbi:hypothetical protein FHT44_004464 [Mycolicibacterium sp. BK634]|uniref:hypothetical protein n=1 Tax=Mycolicibacterium sp. BK634 TaxID=2587099 RepID=UPI00161DAD57|nr:hypothetical protein [Mycolicibacterium sp. BK634]MBB3751969.1 hypothetical protein [Mycolicibacterium sp. BK634]